MRPSRLFFCVVVCCVFLFALWPLGHWVSAQSTATSPYDPLLFRGYSTLIDGQYFTRVDVVDVSSSYFISTFDPTVNDPDPSAGVVPLVAVTPDGSHLYAAITNTGYFATVQIFDTTTFSPLLSSSQAIQLSGYFPLAIAASPNGKFVDVLDSSCSITAINRSQGDQSTSVTTAPLPSGACLAAESGFRGGIAFSPDSSVAFATVYSSSGDTDAISTYILDISTGDFTQVAAGATGGSGVAINPNGSLAYLLNAYSFVAPEYSVSVVASPGGELQTVNGASYFSLYSAPNYFEPSSTYNVPSISTDGSTLFVPGYAVGLSTNALALVNTSTINATSPPNISLNTQEGISTGIVFTTEPKGNHVATELDFGTVSSVVTGVFSSSTSSFNNVLTIANLAGNNVLDFASMAFTPVALTLSPLGPSYVNTGAGPVQFTLTDLHDTGVTWQVNGIAGGNSSVGTIVGQACSSGTCLGVYTPPAGLTTTQTFTITATSVWNPSITSAQAQVVVVAPLAITTSCPLPSGQAGSAYSESLTATGGVTPYSWSVTLGSLPSGFTLNSATGVIGGTTTVAGPYSFTLQVTDSELTPVSVPKSCSMQINPGPGTISATGGTPQSATVNTAFASPLSATVTDAYSNPVAGVTVTFIAPGSGASGTFAEGGASYSATTNTAGVATSAVFTANNVAGLYQVIAGASSVSGAAIFALTNTPVTALTPSQTPPPGGQQGTPYTGTLSATGGVPPYKWSFANGFTPPSWLQLSPAGTLSGTPPAVGSYTLQVTVTDSQKTSVTQQYSLIIAESGSISVVVLPHLSTLGISTSSTPSTQTFYAEDNMGNYTGVQWTLGFATGQTCTGSDGTLMSNPDGTALYTAPTAIPTNNGQAAPCLIQITAQSSIAGQSASASSTFVLSNNGLGACCVSPGNGVELQVVVPADQGGSGKVGAELSGVSPTGSDSTVPFNLTCTASNNNPQGPAPQGIGCFFQNENSPVAPSISTITGANPIAFCTIFATGSSPTTTLSLPRSWTWFGANSKRFAYGLVASVLSCFVLFMLATWNHSIARKRYAWVICTALLLIVATGLVAGCSSFSTPTGPPSTSVSKYNVTAAGCYTVTITATPSQATSSSGTPFVQSQLLVPLTVGSCSN